MSRLAWAALALAGCGAGDGFHCASDRPCDDGAQCIDASCARVDQSCASGLRFDDTAGARSYQCANLDMAVDPNCGNGTIDPGETCDDGPGSPLPCPQSCDDGNPCTTDTVINQACHRECVNSINGHDDNTPCAFPDGGAAGRCESFRCCTGCFDGVCRSGQDPGSCGAGGMACQACAVGAACNSYFCAPDGTCGAAQLPDTSPCDGGACASGACCAGCLQPVDGGATCQPGDTTLACGAGGSPCASCITACAVDGGARCINCVPSCGGKSCGSDLCGGQCGACVNGQVCQNGTCVCMPSGTEAGDAVCGDGIDQDCDGKTDCADSGCLGFRCATGFCEGGQCTPGCRIAGQFFAAGAKNPLSSCQTCDPTADDSGWTNVADGTIACSIAALTGLCYQGACCTGCWDGNTCQGGGGNGACGRQGGTCLDCTSMQGLGCAFCTTGRCMMVNDGEDCGSNCGTVCNTCPMFMNSSCLVTSRCKNHLCTPIQTQCCAQLGCNQCP